ncbi:ARM REPEAT PROTEIN INTERACTING WITH ABF2-like isoform X2 [Papaver somniferum]|uniref:ARM REPEAT PROTEIN INTERACTING WITH ABF2-like isoform X2 n=1 Tax=Papaver somniferum TaxID=3469 RepID=UPI000E705B34|nr:ARM REPEAT PROTEIN INTERACTING WITH ABF2-like isoform X2 [Papaver somniferum]
MEEEFSYLIVLADRIRDAVKESESFKLECSQVSKQVNHLSLMFRSVIRLSTNTTVTTNTSSTNHYQSSFYERPVRRIISEVSKALEKTLTLVRKCRQGNCFFHFLTITITSAADFRKIFILLDTSIGDLEWVLSVYDVNSLESNAANELASLTKDNHRNKKIIVEEGGIPPLLRLLKQGSSSPESQIAASNALSYLATDRQRIRTILSEHGAPIIVQVLHESIMSVQISVANLVSRMAKNDPAAQEEFARENIIRPLVSVLSFDTFLDEPKPQPQRPTSFHSLVRINKDLQGGKSNVGIRGSSMHNKYERENENPDVKLELKTKCSEALWMLSKESTSNSRRITETKGLLCLAKIIEKERDELQMNCLMTVMEITSAAEANADLRRAAFKTNSPASKAVTEQLLALVHQETSPSLQIPAIKSIGSLARTFHARETRVIKPVVLQLGNKNLDVATEAAIALGKFACPENFLCVEHSKTIIEYGGVTPLLRLLRPGNDRAQMHGLILLCYLALNVDSGEGLERARSALEGAARSSVLMQNCPSLRNLIPNAISHLAVYETGVYTLMQSYTI